MTYSDKPVHLARANHDTMDFTSAQAGAFRTSKDLEPQKIADKDEDKDVQKMLSNESNKPIGLCAIGVALLSFAAMVGVRMRRGMQPPIALVSSCGHGIDMSMPNAAAVGAGVKTTPTETATGPVAAFFVSPHQQRTMQTLKPASEVTVAQPLAAP